MGTMSFIGEEALLVLGLGRADAASAAWFKNAHFRVTLGLSARTLIGPALEAGLRESLVAVLGLQVRENRVYPRSSSQ